MRVVLLSLLMLLVLNACVNKQQIDLKILLELENKLMKVEDVAANETLAKDVLLAYDEFILAYPHAEQIPELLFKSGEVLKGLGAHLKSAKAFHKVHTQYPNAKIAPIALFHQAHCFEALEQHLTAKNTYEDFIKRYPKHPYVSQANGMIQILNLSDEELIYKFQN